LEAGVADLFRGRGVVFSVQRQIYCLALGKAFSLPPLKNISDLTDLLLIIFQGEFPVLKNLRPVVLSLLKEDFVGFRLSTVNPGRNFIERWVNWRIQFLHQLVLLLRFKHHTRIYIRQHLMTQGKQSFTGRFRAFRRIGLVRC